MLAQSATSEVDHAPLITFAREPIDSLWSEMIPLLLAHWQEVATWQDIPLDPDMDAYEAAEEAGMLRVFTVRVDSKLVGYAAYIVRTHLHYQGSKQAVQDVLYLSPEHRRGKIGYKLIQHGEAELKAEGVQAVYQHVKESHDFGPLLERIGYKMIEKVYARRLDDG